MLRAFLARQFARPSGWIGSRLIAPWLDWISAAMNPLALALLDPRPGERVLDLGFGGGGLIRELRRAGCVAIGVDVSDVAVERARRRFPDVELHCARAERLPLGACSIDKAVSLNSLYFWGDPQAAMAELARVVRPGGRLVLLFEPPEELRKWPGHRHGFRLFEVAEVRGLMAEAGFGEIEARWGTGRKPDRFCGLSGSRIGANRGGMEDELDPGFADLFARGERPPCQLYLISPLETGGGFPTRLEQALSGGAVAAFQFRVKGRDQHEAAALAEPLQRICEAHEVAFIVNDDMGLAKRLGADGVHLGQADGDPRDARALLGPSAQIGVTCHDSRHLAMEAGEAGADYVAFGAFFPTSTKETSHQPDPSILSWWSSLFEIPSVAIGGITPENGRALVEAGADFLAVCGSVWNHPEGPAAAVAAFQEILRP